MKKILKDSFKLLIVFFGLSFLLISCEYKEIADADYPAAKLYMPSAVNGVFTIDNVPQRTEFLPTPGQAYRFTIDNAKNKLIIPLGVYRAGIDRSGKVTVDIIVNTDTIGQLITATKIPTLTTVLPSSHYTLPATADVADGSPTGTFNLEIDLDYLLSFPDAIFGIGVGISSPKMAVNPLLKTTVIVLYTKILKTTSNFSFTIDGTDKSRVSITNTSLYAMKYLWNFGDNTTDSIKAPVHFYALSGSYTITLTSVGVLGTVNQSVKILPITILLLPVPNYIYLASIGNTRQIVFTNTSIKCVSYSWNFGDGSTVSIDASPTHTYATAGTYSVVLTGTGDTGATATKSTSITVN